MTEKLRCKKTITVYSPGTQEIEFDTFVGYQAGIKLMFENMNKVFRLQMVEWKDGLCKIKLVPHDCVSYEYFTEHDEYVTETEVVDNAESKSR